MKTWLCFEKQMCSEAGRDGAADISLIFYLTCRAYFCSYSKLLIAPLFVTNWRSLSAALSGKSRPREQFKNRLNGSMKILGVDLQKAKDNIKNKIEGYPRVERGNLSRPF